MPTELLTVLITATAAIVASVAAQLTGATISGRHARKRLEWERRQADLTRYADLRWHLFGDVMTQLHIIDREVELCEDRSIIQEHWDSKSYAAAVDDLQRLIGRTRLVDASVAEDLVDFLDQARDYVEFWMIPGNDSNRTWEHKLLSDRVAVIGTRLAAQLGMPDTGGQRAIAR